MEVKISSRSFKMGLILGCILMSLQSCKTDAKNTEAAADNSEKEVDADQALINKYNAYVAVWNKVTPEIERTHSFYVNMFDLETGLPKKKQEVYYIPVYDRTNVILDLKNMLAQKPEMPMLDKIGGSLVESYEELNGPLKELTDYYKLKAYLDDDFAKAKQLHPLVLKNLNSFIELSNGMIPHIREMDEAFRQKELNDLKEKGLHIRYAHALLLDSMKKHLETLSGIGYENYGEVDLKRYDEALKQVVENYGVFKKRASKNEDLRKEFKGAHLLSMFQRAVDNYIKTARDFRDTATDENKYNALMQSVRRQGGNTIIGQGSHESIYKAYDKVITESNYMN
ncbi:DUF3829 domain-containing protein [Sungkyunkwania multivorans]|uniref:DUF3829 domain-containing protein n=1 Tax=Sungkyunkwania multivorans TaxID=1173618 RepID=A0ABW3CU29_9FLAO